MANVIYRGPVRNQPETENLPVAGAYKPGLLVTSDGSQLSQATVDEGKFLVLSNREFYDHGVETAYTSGETGVAYRVKPDDEVQCRMAADTYTYGQELTINASGQLAAAAATNRVVAYFDQAGGAVTADALADVVIANSYVKG